MSEYRWITTNKQGSCQSCKELIEQGERVLWQCKTPYVWCAKCGTASGIIDKQAEQPQIQQTTSSIINNAAVTPTPFVSPSRESDAVKGHMENMESAKQLRNTLALLTVAIHDLTVEIKSHRRSQDLNQMLGRPEQ